jgi:hypothetical protein
MSKILLVLSLIATPALAEGYATDEGLWIEPVPHSTRPAPLKCYALRDQLVCNRQPAVIERAPIIEQPTNCNRARTRCW